MPTYRSDYSSKIVLTSKMKRYLKKEKARAAYAESVRKTWGK